MMLPIDPWYQKALDALEAGSLPESDMPDLTARLADRLELADVPDAYHNQCWDIFSEYRIYIHNLPVTVSNFAKIAKAARDLADAIANTGDSQSYRIIDDDLIRRIISDTNSSHIMHRAIDEGRWIGSASPNIGMERYMRAFADMMEEDIDGIQYGLAYLGEVGAPQSNSRSLNRFVLRRARVIVDNIGSREWRAELPDRWQPKEHGLDGSRAPRGNNQIAANLASIILTKEFSSHDVTKAFEARKKTTYSKRGANPKSQ